MEEVTRKRVLRKLEGLPEDQLYQVLDYIEFLEAKYARLASQKPDAFQEFAERVEDQMRLRSVAPKAMRGTMKIMSAAGRVLDGVRDLGRDVGRGPERRGPAEDGQRNGSGQRRSPTSGRPPASGGEG